MVKERFVRNREVISCMWVAVPPWMMSMKHTPEVIIFIGNSMYLYSTHHHALKYLDR